MNLERVVSGVNYTGYAIYTDFSISDSSTNYALALTYSSGTSYSFIFNKIYLVGDSLSVHNGMQFSTFDVDNDINLNDNCA